MTLRPPTLRLNIDALHLHGFGHEHRDAFRLELERALAALVAERGMPGGVARPPSIGHVRYDATTADPASAARAAAEAVWDALVSAVGRAR